MNMPEVCQATPAGWYIHSPVQRPPLEELMGGSEASVNAMSWNDGPSI